MGGDEPVRAKGEGIVPMPVGNDRAASVQDRKQGGEIPKIQNRIGHHVRSTAGEKRIAETVAPRPVEPRRGQKRIPSGAAVVAIGRFRIGRQQRAIGEPFGIAHAENPFAEPRGFIVPDVELTEGGNVNGAPNGFLSAAQGDQCAEERTSRGKRARAVDGINNPCVFRVRRHIVQLFAEDSVAGPLLGDLRAQHRLRPAVGVGHRAVVLFPLHPQIGAREVGHDRIRAGPREMPQKGSHCLRIHKGKSIDPPQPLPQPPNPLTRDREGGQ